MKRSSIPLAVLALLNSAIPGSSKTPGIDAGQGFRPACVVQGATGRSDRSGDPEQTGNSQAHASAVVRESEKAATPQKATAQPDRFGLEIIAADGHSPVYMTVAPERANPAWMWAGRFPLLPFQQAMANKLPVTAVKFAAVMEGQAARVKVSLMLGQYHDKEKNVASYLIKENESTDTPELSDFGIAPFRIKDVKLKPWSAIVPAITNKTRSIEVITVEGQATLFPAFKVMVKNASSKSVIALDLNVTVPKGGPLLSRPQAVEGKTLIDPGALYDFAARSGDGGAISEDGYEPQAPTGIVINAVMFSDGTYEGERGPALDQFALVAGHSAQLKRVVGLLDAALGAPSVDLRSLKAELASLSDEVEQPAIEEAFAQYTLLADAPRPKAIAMFRHGVHRVKQLLTEDIKAFEKNHGPAGKEETRSWLTATRQKYADWLGRL